MGSERLLRPCIILRIEYIETGRGARLQEQVKEVPVLIAQSGTLQGKRWVLNHDRFVIGRGEDSDVVIPDRQVSRHHACVRRTQDTYLIEDLGSKNGTHLNGVRILEPKSLQDGDIIQIALALELVFVGTEATIPLMSMEVSQMGLARLRMDPQAHRVLVMDVEVEPPLSPPQYRLLELLYRSPGRVISRDEIAEYVWPGTKGIGVSNQAIDALVRRLRDKLAEVDPGHDYVVTVRGHGFRLDNPA
jgi:pSer/pThr/pTyr-binding forkhead associated (FHA) protein